MTKDFMSPEGLMDWLMSTSKRIYEQDGHLTATLWCRWPGHLASLQLGAGHPGDIAAAVLTIVSAGFPLTFAAMVSESWYTKIEGATEADCEEMHNIPRGYLEAKSTTDPNVRTSLMIHAIDPFDPSRTWTATSVVGGDPRSPEWEDIPIGEVDGFIAVAMATAIRVGTEARATAPKGLPLEQWLEGLGRHGLVTAALLWDEPSEGN